MFSSVPGPWAGALSGLELVILLVLGWGWNLPLLGLGFKVNSGGVVEERNGCLYFR